MQKDALKKNSCVLITLTPFVPNINAQPPN